MSDKQAFYDFIYSVHDLSEDVSLASTLKLYADAQVIFESAQARIGNANSRLDSIAQNSAKVQEYVSQGQRFNAIKELRLLTGCSLMEAKESVDRIYYS